MSEDAEMPSLRDESLDFVQTAPKRFVFEAVVPAPRERVFEAVSADPSTWKEWFPGFADGGYEGPPPWGLGTKRWVKVGPTKYFETMVAWDEPSRWTYRVDSSTAPMAKALIEEWTFDEHPDGTLVRWTFAIEPRLIFKLAAPLASRTMGRLFTKAMHNLGNRITNRKG